MTHTQPIGLDSSLGFLNQDGLCSAFCSYALRSAGVPVDPLGHSRPADLERALYALGWRYCDPSLAPQGASAFVSSGPPHTGLVAAHVGARVVLLNSENPEGVP
ncbi:MAG: hypothetical protein AAFQ82_10210, partial [Myxococcota bacterium]